MSVGDDGWIVPSWLVPAKVGALITTRAGGVSEAKYASLNLGDHVGDDLARVARNRAILRARLPAEPKWLRQVHGAHVASADALDAPIAADASVARRANSVCAILTADCLPLLLCDRAATVVGAAHAGWRGLAAGVIEATVAAMDTPASELMAYLGPAIGPASYEVGNEVREAFVARDNDTASAFAPRENGKWLADLYALARLRLRGTGVSEIHGGDFCTLLEGERFFSFRRDGETGRMASLIWLR
jgi:polyphenol oxidase